VVEAIFLSFGPDREHPRLASVLVRGPFQIDFFRSK
jgi:hypothetical protein